MRRASVKWLALAVLMVSAFVMARIAFLRQTTPVAEPVAGIPVQETALPEVERARLVLVDDALVIEGTTAPFSGYMVEYYEDGSHKTRSRIEGGVLHGVVRGWFPDGTLESEEHFVRGVSHGVRQRWHANGTLASRTEIAEGQVHGEFVTWDENGEMTQRIQMAHGQPQGVSEAYYPGGFVRTRVTIKDGTIMAQESWDNQVMR